MRLKDELPSLEGATNWLNGKEVTKEEIIDEHMPVFIHFWAVSCHYCKITMPNINQMYNDYQGKLKIIAIHMPISEEDFDFYHVKDHAKIQHISHPICTDNELTLSSLFSNRYVPAYYLFDQYGKLRHFQEGKGNIKMLSNRIQRILRTKK